MIAIGLILIVGIVIGIAIAAGIAQEKHDTKAANAARQQNVQEHLTKVLALLDTKQEITNDDVQRALGVSDATAANYLAELERTGAIVRTGEAGRGVSYRRNG